MRGEEPAGSRSLGKWGSPAEDVLGWERRLLLFRCFRGSLKNHLAKRGMQVPELQKDQSSEKSTRF